ncbi:MAG: PEP-CTERM sorting domain-containing protein [Luteolibacter sp.]|jgi:hypothetical protein|nr:PEP-CTERM sorting domain-containing protein [Luteolibacter sp.]
MKHKNKLIAALVLASPALITTAQAATTYSNDFSSYSNGSLVGQGAWYQGVAGGAPQVASGIISGDTTTSAKDFSSGALFAGTETAAILQVDVLSTRGFSGMEFYLGGTGATDPINDDWSGTQKLFGPTVGFANGPFGDGYQFRLGVKASDGSWSHVTATPGSAPSLENTITLQLVMDFTANSGAGSGSVYFKNLTLGDTSFTAVDGLQNINLGLNYLDSTATPSDWNQVAFRTSNSGDGFAHSIDNLLVTGSAIPEPSTIGLFALCGWMFGFRRSRR